MNSKCPKCGKGMEEGFIAEQGLANPQPTRWIPGKPDFSPFSKADAHRRAAFPVQTFRCTGCGYLESYAFGQKE